MGKYLEVLTNKISKIKSNIDYKKQNKACTDALNQPIIANNEDAINEIWSALKKTQTNLNGKQNMLK